LFNPNQICVLRDDSGLVIERPILQYFDEETLICPLSGKFFVGDRQNMVYLSIKDYDS
jgi:hypothetical protein